MRSELIFGSMFVTIGNTQITTFESLGQNDADVAKYIHWFVAGQKDQGQHWGPS